MKHLLAMAAFSALAVATYGNYRRNRDRQNRLMPTTSWPAPTMVTPEPPLTSSSVFAGDVTRLGMPDADSAA